MNDENKGTLFEIFTLVLKKDFGNQTVIERETTENWDSLKHLELVFAVEDAFDIHLSEEQIVKIKSSDDFLAIIAEQKNAA